MEDQKAVSEETPTITVEIVAPEMPLVLADATFLSTLKTVDAQVVALKITDAQSNQHAADLLQRLTAARNKLNESRLALKRRFDPVLEKIDQTARGPTARIDALKKMLSDAQIAWGKHQKQLADEAEKKRQDDIARLEKLRAEEEAATKRVADEAAKKAADAAALIAANPPAMDVDFGDDDLVDESPVAQPAPQKTEIQKQLEAVRHAPAVVPVKAAGVRTVTTLVPVVIDVNRLPDMFVDKTAKIKAIMSTFCSGWKEGQPLPVLDGVRFDIKTEVQSTGRANF